MRKPLTTSPVFDRAWDEFLSNDWPFAGSGGIEAVSRPPVNIVEGDADYRIEIAAPGLVKSDFKITFNKDILTIAVEKEVAVEGKDKILRREFSFLNFQRSFRLPNTIDVAGIRASYEQGILLVVLPKREEARVKPPMDIRID
jgi:HSP20 family protein